MSVRHVGFEKAPGEQRKRENDEEEEEREGGSLGGKRLLRRRALWGALAVRDFYVAVRSWKPWW